MLGKILACIGGKVLGVSGIQRGVTILGYLEYRRVAVLNGIQGVDRVTVLEAGHRQAGTGSSSIMDPGPFRSARGPRPSRGCLEGPWWPFLAGCKRALLFLIVDLPTCHWYYLYQHVWGNPMSKCFLPILKPSFVMFWTIVCLRSERQAQLPQCR